MLISEQGDANNVFTVPLTSKTLSLLVGEFVLTEWQQAELNVQTVVKRGIYTFHEKLTIKSVGQLSDADISKLNILLR